MGRRSGIATLSLRTSVAYLRRALEIAAFDKPIPAEQALEWGLTTRVAKDGEAVAEAQSMCRELAAGSLHSYGLSKQLLTDSFSTSFETQLEQSVSYPVG